MIKVFIILTTLYAPHVGVKVQEIEVHSTESCNRVVAVLNKQASRDPKFFVQARCETRMVEKPKETK
jgi:hypothetical protein